jgi:hypothetical protein
VLSVPVTVTWVAFTALTVKVDELPTAIEVGLADMATVGAPDLRLTLPPHPVRRTGSTMPEITQEKAKRADLQTRTFVTTYSFLSPEGC